MDSRQYKGSGTYLKAADLAGKEPRRVKIVRVADFTDNGKSKLALEFANTDKKFALNKGNIEALEAAYGFNTDDWVGKQVTLSHDPDVRYQGRTVGGIKLSVSK